LTATKRKIRTPKTTPTRRKMLKHVIRKVYHSPLCITESGFRAIDTVIQNKLAGVMGDFEEPDPVEAIDLVSVDGKTIGVLNIDGIIGHRVSGIEKACGVADVTDIKQAFRALISNDSVDGIVMSISSSGGGVTGVPELASEIMEGRKIKPIASFTDDLMASAAYWIGSSAEFIGMTPTADIGSIGVYSALFDSTRKFQQEGIDVHLVKAGTRKAEGFAGVPVSAEAIASLQESVDKIYAMFTGHVSEARSNAVSSETMQGQTFMGEDGVDAKLADVVVADFEEFLVGFAKSIS
jgi:ClpP class serine protease